MLEASLDIRRGHFHLHIDCCLRAPWTVIFGPSGAGKSTLLRMLAGLDAAWPGTRRVTLDGQVLVSPRIDARSRGGAPLATMVAQQPALFPHMSVPANVAYGLAHLERRERSARVEQMLDLVGASTLAGRNPRDLSGGEAQRIALARALAPHPRLLLLDEPFSALDGAAADALLQRVQPWLASRQIAAIQSTHDATEAFITGAEVILLRDGRMVAQGPARDVLAAERERLAQALQLD